MPPDDTSDREVWTVVCRTCGAPWQEGMPKLLMCSRCRSNVTRYCDRDCQVKDWARHKVWCEVNRGTTTALEKRALVDPLAALHNDQLAKFKRLKSVHAACMLACLAAYRIGARRPLHTTHVVLLSWEYDHTTPALVDQFQLVRGEVLTHEAMTRNFRGPREDERGQAAKEKGMGEASMYSQDALNGTFGCGHLPLNLLRMPLVHTSTRGPKSKGPQNGKDDAAVYYYDTMITQDIRTTSGTWIDRNELVISDLLPPPSWDWVDALRKRIAAGGSVDREHIDIYRELTTRELREQRVIREKTGQSGADLEMTMLNLARIRQYFDWEGPNYAES